MSLSFKTRKMEKTIIIGGGPAGLTAAYQLCKAGLPCVVLEKDSVVGGLSRTVDYKGYLFDIGGHRFFTKVKRVNQMWEAFGSSILGCGLASAQIIAPGREGSQLGGGQAGLHPNR